jgi:hypothetical protein
MLILLMKLGGGLEISIIRKAESRGDPDVSSSAFGQWVHDEIPRTFYWADIDGASYKRATGILRVFEHKWVGQELKPSQNSILPKIAKAIAHMIETKLVSAGSGVFVV